MDMRKNILWIAPLLMLAACAEPSKVKKPRDQMTDREKEEALANSPLPGAGVVKKSLAIADKEAAHQAMIDSISNGN
jgi:hypothetical protein